MPVLGQALARLSALLRLPTRRSRLTLEGDLADLVSALAQRTRRTPDQALADLLAHGLDGLEMEQELRRAWADLSPRQQEVLRLAAQGWSNQQIAAHLVLAPTTIKTHIQRAMLRFGVHSRAELCQALARFLAEG